MLNDFFKAVSVAAAVLIASSVTGPGSAYAQSSDPCFEVSSDPDEPFDPDFSYPECGESANVVTQLGSSLTAIGDAMVNQQLNFGAFSAFVAPTGRVRHTEHDGLTIKGLGTSTGEFKTDEGSVFANASYDLPGTYFGGKIRVSGLLGYNGLTQDDEAKSFKNEIDAFIYGGSYLWSQGNFYSMSLIIGLSGEADGRNIGGKYNYDVDGYFTNSVMGYTWDMAGGWKFDTRVNLGHYDIEGDRFAIPTLGGLAIEGSAEAWNGGIKGTVFTIIEMGGGVARPYLAASYKNVFDEDIKVRGDFTADFDQDDNYGLLEAGYDFVQGPWTYGAAVYTEFSGDQDTVGGRLGVSVKLQ
jgi:hypothetical protein